MKAKSKRYLIVASTLAFSVIAGTVIFDSGDPHSALAQDIASDKTTKNLAIRFTDDGRLLQPSG